VPQLHLPELLERVAQLWLEQQLQQGPPQQQEEEQQPWRVLEQN
jgi:hypothetical protein